MWVTYFENLLNDSAFYRTYAQRLEKKEVNGEFTYIIENPSFEENYESFPFKVYNNPTDGLVCYCYSDSKSIKLLGENLAPAIGEAIGTIPLKYILEEESKLVEYENIGAVNINAKLNSSIKSLCDQLVSSGISIRTFEVKDSNTILLNIESSSFLDLISDIEFTRFFCLNFFISNHCSIVPITKRSSNLLKFSIRLLKKLKASEKKKLSKLKNLSLFEDKVEVENLGSNSSALHQIISVVSQISA